MVIPVMRINLYVIKRDQGNPCSSRWSEVEKEAIAEVDSGLDSPILATERMSRYRTKRSKTRLWPGTHSHQQLAVIHPDQNLPPALSFTVWP